MYYLRTTTLYSITKYITASVFYVDMYVWYVLNNKCSLALVFDRFFIQIELVFNCNLQIFQG